jgi:hypothetical protein
MANADLINYIKQARRASEKDEGIRANLLARGWLASDIEEGFQAANQYSFSAPDIASAPSTAQDPIKETENVQLKEDNQGKRYLKEILVGVAVILVLLAAVFAFFYFKDRAQEQKRAKESTAISQQKPEEIKDKEALFASSSPEAAFQKPEEKDLSVLTAGWQELQFKKHGLSLKVPTEYKQIEYKDAPTTDQYKTTLLEAGYQNSKKESVSFGIFKYGEEKIKALAECDSLIAKGQSASQPMCLLLPVNQIRSLGKRVLAQEIKIGENLAYLYSTELNQGARIKYLDIYLDKETIILFGACLEQHSELCLIL